MGVEKSKYISIVADVSAGLSLPGAPRHSAINSWRAISCHRARGAQLGRGHLPAPLGNLSLGNARPSGGRRHKGGIPARSERAERAPGSPPRARPRDHALCPPTAALCWRRSTRPRPLGPGPSHRARPAQPSGATAQRARRGPTPPPPRLSTGTPRTGRLRPPLAAPARSRAGAGPGLPGEGGGSRGGGGGCSSIAMATVTSSHPGSNWRKPRGPSRSPRANRACALPALAPAAARCPRIGCRGAGGRGRARRRGRDWPRGRGLSSG